MCGNSAARRRLLAVNLTRRRHHSTGTEKRVCCRDSPLGVVGLRSRLGLLVIASKESASVLGSAGSENKSSASLVAFDLLSLSSRRGGSSIVERAQFVAMFVAWEAEGALHAYVAALSHGILALALGFKSRTCHEYRYASCANTGSSPPPCHVSSLSSFAAVQPLSGLFDEVRRLVACNFSAPTACTLVTDAFAV